MQPMSRRGAWRVRQRSRPVVAPGWCRILAPSDYVQSPSPSLRPPSPPLGGEGWDEGVRFMESVSSHPILLENPFVEGDPEAGTGGYLDLAVFETERRLGHIFHVIERRGCVG